MSVEAYRLIFFLSKYNMHALGLWEEEGSYLEVWLRKEEELRTGT